MNDLLLRAAAGKPTPRPPVWLMRQAGRHLPEYREMRSNYSFREAIETPDIAVEISLQPWERYRPDGVVVFSDILTALLPLGFDYEIESGVGPVIDDPITSPAMVPTRYDPVDESLGFVRETLTRLKEELDQQAAVIGFAGGPFTLASYLIAGKSTRSQFPARRFLAEHPSAFSDLIDVLIDLVIDHLQFQIASGADVVQLFDTYAGILPPSMYEQYILPAHQRIFDALDAPSIVFVRNMAGNLEFLSRTGADVVGLDWTCDLSVAREELGDHPVQGNFDPAWLFSPPETIADRTTELIEHGGNQGHIVNLGHGVNKNTPVSGVETFVTTVKDWSAC